MIVCYQVENEAFVDYNCKKIIILSKLKMQAEKNSYFWKLKVILLPNVMTKIQHLKLK